MIIQNLTKGAVVTVKILGGDEVVARLDEDYTKGKNIRLVKPLVVMMGQQGFGMMPFMLTAEHGTVVELSHDKILCVGKTLKEVADEYVRQTSGLLNMGG
jgi:hypothetical protein